MIEQQTTSLSTTRAVVRDLDGEFALVEASQTGCGRCNEPGGCGGLHPGKILCASKPRLFRALNTVGAQVGDSVNVAVAEGAIGAAATRAYLLPLALLLAGAIAGEALFGHRVGLWASVSGALLGLGLGWRSLSAHRLSRKPMLPKIVERNILADKESS